MASPPVPSWNFPVVMICKKIIVGAILLMLLHGYPCRAQDDEIPAEDLEVIEMLDLLDNLDVLEEDVGLLEFLTAVGDEYDEDQ